jgi:hypothetical protein
MSNEIVESPSHALDGFDAWGGDEEEDARAEEG